MEGKLGRENTYPWLSSPLSPNPSPKRARGFDLFLSPLPPVLGGRGRGMEGKTRTGDHLPLDKIFPLPKPLSQEGEGL